MNQLPQNAAQGASLHYIFKAAAVCGGQCNIAREGKLSDQDKNCLYICGSNAAATRVVHLKFMASQAEEFAEQEE